MPRNTYERLALLRKRTGRSFGDLFEALLQKKEIPVAEAYQQGYNTGFADARRRYLVQFQCAKCGGWLDVERLTTRIELGQYLTKTGWHHKQSPSNTNPTE